MLHVCNTDHEEIAYTAPMCPACLIISHYLRKMEELENYAAQLKECVTNHGEEKASGS